MNFSDLKSLILKAKPVPLRVRDHWLSRESVFTVTKVN